VRFLNVPSFVLFGGVAVKVGARHIRADIAFGGEFYAIVDSEAMGLPLDREHLPEFRRAGMEIVDAVHALRTVVHPIDATTRGLSGVIFTGPATEPASAVDVIGSAGAQRADLRNVTVFGDGQVDRSPSGTGTAAVMAVVDAMGLLSRDVPFVHESVFGTRLSGQLAGRTTAGGLDAALFEIGGSAWVTGEHTFVLADDDPLRNGFPVS
jgi:proline racemase